MRSAHVPTAGTADLAEARARGLLQEARALARWAAAVLRQLDVAATKKAVVKLLECQVCKARTA